MAPVNVSTSRMTVILPDFVYNILHPTRPLKYFEVLGNGLALG